MHGTMPPLAQATWGHAEEERLREEGFVVIPSFLTSAGVVELNDMIDELLSEPSEGGYDWTCPWLFDHRAGRVLWELATQPALLEIMRSECGPNVCLWAGGLALKAAEKEREHTGEIPWHQVRARRAKLSSPLLTLTARRMRRTGISSRSGTA